MININLITDEIKPFINSDSKKTSNRVNLIEDSFNTNKQKSGIPVVLIVVLFVLGGVGFAVYKFILPVMMADQTNQKGAAESVEMPNPSGVGIDDDKAKSTVNLDKKRDEDNFVSKTVKTDVVSNDVTTKNDSKINNSTHKSNRIKSSNKRVNSRKVRRYRRRVPVPSFKNYQYLEHKNPFNFVYALNQYGDLSGVNKLNINGARTAYIELSNSDSKLKQLLNQSGFSVNLRDQNRKFDIRFSNKTSSYELKDASEYLDIKNKIYNILSNYNCQVTLLNQNVEKGYVVYTMIINSDNITAQNAILCINDILKLYNGIGVNSFIYNNNKLTFVLKNYFN